MEFSFVLFSKFQGIIRKYGNNFYQAHKNITAFLLKFCTNITNAEEFYLEFYINRIKVLENTDSMTFRS